MQWVSDRNLGQSSTWLPGSHCRAPAAALPLVMARCGGAWWLSASSPPALARRCGLPLSQSRSRAARTSRHGANPGTNAWGFALMRRASDGAHRSLSFTLLIAAAASAPACTNLPGASIPRLSFSPCLRWGRSRARASSYSCNAHGTAASSAGFNDRCEQASPIAAPQDMRHTETRVPREGMLVVARWETLMAQRW